MPLIDKSKVSLGIFGADLEPADITRLLGREPTHSRRRGELGSSKLNDKPVPPRGSWHLRVDDKTPSDVDGQICELLADLPQEASVWRELAQYYVRINVGLFMREGNEGFELEAETLKQLSDRGLRITFDVYDPSR